MKQYIYKMTVDNGGAPCAAGGLLSLAICKPKIRKAAGVGDWIFGFGSKHCAPGCLVWVAEVTGKEFGSDYYAKPEYSRRGDRIYSLDPVSGGPEYIEGSRYHGLEYQKMQDVGNNWEKAGALISNNFRYLGNKPHPIDPKKYPYLWNKLLRLTRGHRVNFSDPELADLQKLKEEVFQQFPGQVTVNPNNPMSRCCYRSTKATAEDQKRTC